MNKITRKQNSLYADNLIRKLYNIGFVVEPRDINVSKRAYHRWFNQTKKHKLGKRKNNG